MSRSLYLINPTSDFPSYFGAEVFAGRGYSPATMAADLALPTLAALAPSDFTVVLCDEHITPVDFDADVDYVGITGKITQIGRMAQIAQEFRRRGRVVLIGGPCASLSPQRLRPHCDILVRGEIEEIAEQLFADLRESRWKDEYVGTRPDLALSPVPRWDLYPNARTGVGTVQTSRGCPFECEFCDVIQYLGRNQRHKPVAHVLRELDELYRYGYRYIFLADDNFTVWRSRTKELLAALRQWNERQSQGRVAFITQVSIDATDDDELLDMCSRAGVSYVFVGLETPNADSLREARKRQNLRRDLTEQVERLLEYGIGVMAGMMVGFDADGLDIFERQYQFAMASRVPVFMAGAVVAPEATPLHARMERDGRLVPGDSEAAGVPWNTNLIPLRMTREQLVAGMRWLCNNLYHPTAFEERLAGAIEVFGKRRERGWAAGRWLPQWRRRLDREALGVVLRLAQLDIGAATLLARTTARVVAGPEAAPLAAMSLLQYQQIRYMLEQGDFWDPTLASPRPPKAARTSPPSQAAALAKGVANSANRRAGV